MGGTARPWAHHHGQLNGRPGNQGPDSVNCPWGLCTADPHPGVSAPALRQVRASSMATNRGTSFPCCSFTASCLLGNQGVPSSLTAICMGTA